MKKKLFIVIFFLWVQVTLAQDYLKEEKSGYKGGFIPELKLVEESLNFLVLGDFGRNGEYHQKDVAVQMSKAAATIDSEFVISVGDNFYPNGVQSTQDPHWGASFEDIYFNHNLQTDWYVALGNHDYNGNIQAQIDYSKISRRWNMPATYFKETVELEDGSKALLVFIDTNPFIKSYHSKGDEMEENVKTQDTLAQKKWLIETLQTTDASIKWKIVVGHHPMYSGGKRKTSQDTKDIETVFAPIFDQYKVDAYLCGHEHDLQVIKPKGRYTMQFLSGAGCEVRPTGTREGTLFALSEPGFMTFSLTPKLMLVQLVNAQGKIVYTQELKK
ncbi:purple acid phosphatase family protein [Flavobacterium sp.]|jgi:ribosomal protein L31|uniref:purple acid phosphatase family protein n=1 Tax=Flavobacterium sp. TaxID=239 RepID=UPI0037C10808